MTNESTSRLQFAIFCPRCHRYVANVCHCPCGWERPQPIPVPGEPLWRASGEAKLWGSPAVAGDVILVGGEDGLLRASAISNGSPRWEQALGSPIRDRPVVEGDKVVAGTKAGDVVACDLKGGHELWRYPTGAPGTGALRLVNGVVYFGDALGHLHALDARNGHPVWQRPFAARKRVGATPAVGRELIVVGSYDGYLYAIDARRGASVWECALGDRITAAPEVTENWAFAGSYNGQVVRLDLLSGRLQEHWAFAAEGPLLSDLTLSPDGRMIYVGSADGSLYALDTQTAEVRYRLHTHGSVVATPALWEGLLFVGSNDSHVYALDADSGEELWHFDAGSPVMGMVVVEGTVCVTTHGGVLITLPWHLGQWERMAQYAEVTGRYGEAACFYALAGRLLEAQRLFRREGDSAAAHMLEAAGERTTQNGTYNHDLSLRESKQSLAHIGDKEPLTDSYSLLIGVGDYTHPRFASLPATARDAQAITAVLTDPARCGYPSANVHVLTGEQATAATIRTALKALAESTTPESTVFVYFSGHGGRALENGIWRAYLCPREADPDDLAQTAISGDEFSALLAAIPARKLVVMLDACHAAGSAELKAADGTVVWKSGLPDNYYQALSQGSGRVVIASSKEDQFSYVSGELSLFTNHLVQALNGKAAVRGDGLIHVLDVFHYVNEAVQADKPKQIPILKVKDLDLNFPIALDRGGKGAGPAVSVTPLADIREQIVRDPIGGAKALSEYLKIQPEWAAKRNEVDLKRTDLERIQYELDLFGPDPGNQAAKNRAVYFLLHVCLELERPEQ